MKLSLRNKLLLPTIGVIIIGMAIATFLSYQSSAKALNHAIVAELETVTKGLTNQITAWLKDLKADLEIQSHQALFSNMLWSEGQDIALVEQSNEAMKSFSSKYGFYETIAITNAEGLVVASSRENLVGKLHVGDRQYFKDSMKGTQVLTDTLKSKVSGKPIFVLSAPMIVDEEIAGIILASVDLTIFSTQFIDPIKIGEHGYAYMAAKDGLLSAHPDKDAIMNTNLKENDWGKALFDKRGGVMTYSFQGVEKIVSFHTEPTTGWLIGAGAATDDIFGEIHSMRTQSLIVALLVVLAVAGVVLLIVRPIVAAINQGVGLAKTIQQGDLSQRLNLSRDDEIGQLATALDTMANGLQERAELAEGIADGDLTQTVALASEKDTLGRALANMTNKLNDILGQINISGQQIDSGSTQVSDSSQELSHGATQQASAIEEIGASMGELSGQTKQNAENASSANNLASEARSAADRGASQMQQMVAAMGEINEAGQSIGNIIKTIDEIAFQTNLLALNAAVEAARAGQHGKGFAVVAEEVRNLAARSAKAASETAELIEGSVKKGENGASIASQTAESLDEIVQSIVKTTDLVSEIAAASNEQAEGIGQINNGIGQIDQVIQRNTASAEEGAAAAEELSSQATHLRHMIAQFKLRNQGSLNIAAPAPVASPAAAHSAAPVPTPHVPAQEGWGGEPADSNDAPQIELDSEEFGKY